MDENYVKQLERRVAELNEQIDSLGSLLNQYTSLVHFKILTQKIQKLDTFNYDASNTIRYSFAVNTGGGDLIFAIIDTSHKGYKINYGQPFNQNWHTDNMTSIFLKHEDVQKAREEIANSEEFKRENNRNINDLEIIVRYVKLITNTQNVKYEVIG